jgi:hypothetical protein
MRPTTYIQRRREKQAAEAEAELRGLLGDQMYAQLEDPAGRSLLVEHAREHEAAEEREIEAFWKRYAALSTREKIREEGFTRWTCNTTEGVVFMVAALLSVMWLLGTLLS